MFLAGLELMITAVALPAIVADLADWTRLREASWIINGYLLVYVVTMPLAGRLADLWGNRRLFLAALVLFTVGSLLAGPRPVAGAADRGAPRPGRRRRRARAGRDLGRVAPVRGPSPAACARGRRARSRSWAWPPARSWAPRSSTRSTRRRRSSRLGDRRADRGSRTLAPAWRWVFYVNVPIGIVALRHRLGGEQRLGDAAAPRPRRRRRGRSSSRRSSWARSGR